MEPQVLFLKNGSHYSIASKFHTVSGNICKHDKVITASHQRTGHFLGEIHHACLQMQYPRDCMDASSRHNIYWLHQLHLIPMFVQITQWPFCFFQHHKKRKKEKQHRNMFYCVEISACIKQEAKEQGFDYIPYPVIFVWQGQLRPSAA